jgi:hypothetical protein
MSEMSVSIFPCSDCGSTEEVRHYGEAGKPICFRCSQATPKSRNEARRRMTSDLQAVESRDANGAGVPRRIVPCPPLEPE